MASKMEHNLSVTKLTLKYDKVNHMNCYVHDYVYITSR